MKSERPLNVVFFRTEAGNEPVREWLQELTKAQKKIIGTDILTVQYAWPIGKPLVDSLGGGIWEVRSSLKNTIARTLFIVANEEIVLLHGFTKKTQKTPQDDIELAKNGKNCFCKAMKKNNHRGSDFREFLKDEGILEDVEASALKRAIALQFLKALEESSLSKAEIAARMKTSRAAVDRLLDASNASVTLGTMAKAARALKCKLKFELVPV